MQKEWEYQLRVDLTDEFSEIAREDLKNPKLTSLIDILDKHQAALICQFDAFAGYVAEAEREGTENYPLYEWTKTTIENPDKKAKFVKSFSLYIDGKSVYAKEKADALEADLKSFVGGEIITKISKYDTNPENNPQPPSRG